VKRCDFIAGFCGVAALPRTAGAQQLTLMIKLLVKGREKHADRHGRICTRAQRSWVHRTEGTSRSKSALHLGSVIASRVVFFNRYGDQQCDGAISSRA
jgi:hypothetical protein